MNKNSLSLSYFSLGYRDYIAARFLLNNNFFLQGLTLASSSVEKYLKALLIFHGRSKKKHLSQLDDLKQELANCYYDLTQKFDPRFFTLLSNAYKARYYDNLQEPLTIGFFVNQLIGELDSFVSFIENFVITEIKDLNGNIVKTPYKRAYEEKNEQLIKNNYLFEGITKKEYMERPDDGYAIYVDPNQPFEEYVALGKGIVNEYNGSLTEIKFNFIKENKKENIRC